MDSIVILFLNYDGIKPHHVKSSGQLIYLSPFLSQMDLWFLATVASSFLSWVHLIFSNIVELTMQRYCMNMELNICKN